MKRKKESNNKKELIPEHIFCEGLNELEEQSFDCLVCGSLLNYVSRQAGIIYFRCEWCSGRVFKINAKTKKLVECTNKTYGKLPKLINCPRCKHKSRLSALSEEDLIYNFFCEGCSFECKVLFVGKGIKPTTIMSYDEGNILDMF